MTSEEAVNRDVEIRIAEKFARMAHAGQFRRDGVTPYITHPEAVIEILKPVDDSCGENIQVAWLHDILEDTKYTAQDMISAGIPRHIVHTVEDLTKSEHESYDDYLKRVINNSTARSVKICDILHNLSCDPTKQSVKKYAKALQFLLLSDL